MSNEPRQHPDNPDLNRTTKGSKQDRLNASREQAERGKQERDRRKSGHNSPDE